MTGCGVLSVLLAVLIPFGGVVLVALVWERWMKRRRRAAIQERMSETWRKSHKEDVRG